MTSGITSLPPSPPPTSAVMAIRPLEDPNQPPLVPIGSPRVHTRMPRPPLLPVSPQRPSERREVSVPASDDAANAPLLGASSGNRPIVYYSPVPAEVVNGSEAPYSINATRVREGETNRLVKISKIALLALNIAVFGVSTGFIVKGAIEMDALILTWAELFSGCSVAIFGYYITPERFRKKISILLDSWSYEILFTYSQFVLNLVPEVKRKLVDSICAFVLGAFSVKDSVNVLFSKLSELPTISYPVTQASLRPSLEFASRDSSGLATLQRTVSFVCAVGLTTFCFAFPEYVNTTELGKRKILHAAALFNLGRIVSRLASRLLFLKTEAIKTAYERNADPFVEMPLQNRIINRMEAMINLIDIRLASLAIALPVTAESFGAFVIAALAGGAYGHWVEGKRFYHETSNSSLHHKSSSSESVSEATATSQQVEAPEFAESEVAESEVDEAATGIWQRLKAKVKATAQKVKETVKEYWPSITAFTLLVGYMSAAVITNPDLPKVDGCIATLSISALASFIFSDRIHAVKNRNLNTRLYNEAKFWAATGAPALALAYQFGRNFFKIDDIHIIKTTPSMYLGSLFTWGLWGVCFGVNRANNHHYEKLPEPRQTPGITAIELTLAVVPTVFPKHLPST